MEEGMTTLTVDFEKAEEMTGVSRFTLRKYVKTGRLKVVRVGRRVVIPISELERMFAPGAVSSLKATDSREAGRAR
jgi:excisionase family DNA binding protein